MKSNRYLSTKSYTIDELVTIFRDKKFCKIDNIVLFGSRARGDMSARSDYDFGVVYRDMESNWGAMAEIYNDFLDILELQEYQLDIVDITNANQNIKTSIGEDYILLKGDEDEFSKLLN